jgi:hypothetical protein
VERIFDEVRGMLDSVSCRVSNLTTAGVAFEVLTPYIELWALALCTVTVDC